MRALAVALLAIGLVADAAGAADARYTENLRECLRAIHGAVIIARCGSVLETADAPDVDKRRALQRRGVAYHNENNIDRAIDDFTRAIELEPDETVLYGLRGNTRMRARDYDGAVKDYSEAILRRPEEGVTHALRGNAHRLAGDHDAALRDFDAAIARQPNLLEAYLNRGSTYRAMERYDQALADFERATAIDARDPRPLAAAGRVRFFQGDFATAAERFTAALNRQPGDIFNIGWRYFAVARAGRDAKREIGPFAQRLDRTRWPGPLLSLLLDEQMFEQVELVARTRDPRETAERLTDLYFFQGQLLLIAGKTTEARALFERTLATGDRAPVSSLGATVELKRLGR
jgi:tetratricopeptide (TPR) repeat protein